MLANPGTGSNPNLKPIAHKEPLPGYSLPQIKTGKICYWQILQTQLKRHQCVCLIAHVSKRKDWVLSLTNDIKLHQLHTRIDHWDFPYITLPCQQQRKLWCPCFSGWRWDWDKPSACCGVPYSGLLWHETGHAPSHSSSPWTGDGRRQQPSTGSADESVRLRSTHWKIAPVIGRRPCKWWIGEFMQP